METTTERTDIRREVAIAASPETVWELLTDPEKASKSGGAARRRSTCARAASSTWR